MRATATHLIALVAFALPCVASARGKSPQAPLPRIDVSVIRVGTAMRVRVDGMHLVARSASDGSAVVDRLVTPAERTRLADAADKALADVNPRQTCRGDESYLTVTVGERTASSAVCGAHDVGHEAAADWQALLDVVRALATPPPPE